MTTYTWDALPVIGSGPTLETDIRATLEQWRENMEGMNDEWDAYSGVSGVGATDNVIVRTDGTDGTVVQGSAASIDDNGSINIPTGETYNINGSPHTHSYLSDVVSDTTPQLGGDLDLNQKSIVYDPTPTSDHTWHGDVMTATAGESVVIGDVCYLKSDGKFWKADSDAESTSKGMIAMATGSINADATGTFLIRGFIRDDTWNWTVGAEVFIHTTAGNPTETKPSGSGDIVRILGWAYSADVLWFDPDKSYVEVA